MFLKEWCRGRVWSLGTCCGAGAVLAQFSIRFLQTQRSEENRWRWKNWATRWSTALVESGGKHCKNHNYVFEKNCNNNTFLVDFISHNLQYSESPRNTGEQGDGHFYIRDLNSALSSTNNFFFFSLSTRQPAVCQPASWSVSQPSVSQPLTQSTYQTAHQPA